MTNPFENVEAGLARFADFVKSLASEDPNQEDLNAIVAWAISLPGKQRICKYLEFLRDHRVHVAGLLQAGLEFKLCPEFFGRAVLSFGTGEVRLADLKSYSAAEFSDLVRAHRRASRSPFSLTSPVPLEEMESMAEALRERDLQLERRDGSDPVALMPDPDADGGSREVRYAAESATLTPIRMTATRIPTLREEIKRRGPIGNQELNVLFAIVLGHLRACDVPHHPARAIDFLYGVCELLPPEGSPRWDPKRPHWNRIGRVLGEDDVYRRRALQTAGGFGLILRFD